MTEAEALFQSVLDDLDDDAPRLIYADCLEEHGDADRAEFIRAQCRLAGMKPWADGYTELDLRCRGLERRHPDWLGWLAPFAERGARFFGWQPSPFRRGFPARLTLRPNDLVAHHDRLFAVAPIRGVEINYFGLRGRVRSRYADLPGIPRLAEVRFSCLDATTPAREMLRCLQRLGRLDHFAVTGCRLRDRDARALLAADPVRQARSLKIGGTPLPAPVEREFASASFPNLRRLARVWVPDLAWLAAGHVRRLEELTIDDTGNHLTPDDTRRLAEILPETSLRALSLGEWQLDERGARGLGEAIARVRLESLTLSHNRAPTPLIRSVLGADGFPGLRALFITWVRFDAGFIRQLTGTPVGAGLRVCGLDDMTADGLAALAAPPGLPELASLRLGLTWDRPEDPLPQALRSLLDGRALPRLVSLTLCDARPALGKVRAMDGMGDRLAAAVAESPGAAWLRELRLDLGRLTRSGAAALAGSGHLEGLALLDVGLAADDREARDLLAGRFGSRASLDWGLRTY